jgi:1,4-dihydroxy-6-naphthoate synthase
VADLGSWWESETGLPIPLAAICVRDDVDEALQGEVERAVRASVEYAFAQPEASRAWVREHAQELSDEVCDQHIGAVRERLLDRPRQRGRGRDRAAAAARAGLRCRPDTAQADAGTGS